MAAPPDRFRSPKGGSSSSGGGSGSNGSGSEGEEDEEEAGSGSDDEAAAAAAAAVQSGGDSPTGSGSAARGGGGFELLRGWGMALFAAELEVSHPVTGERLRWALPEPQRFGKLRAQQAARWHKFHGGGDM